MPLTHKKLFDLLQSSLPRVEPHVVAIRLLETRDM